MSARPYRLRRLAMLIATILPATSAWSLGLGAMQLHSYLGQPLLATITLQLNEDENLTLLDCIRTQGVNEDLAGPGPLRQELFVTGNQATVYLRGQEALREPLIGMKVSIGCAETPQLQRTYTLLLDPAPIAERNPAAATAIATPSVTETAPTAKPAPAAKARPVRPALARAKRAATTASQVTPAASAPAHAAAGPATTAQAQTSDPNYSLKIETASATEIRAQDLENELQVLQNQHAQLRVEMTQLEERMARLQLQLEGPTFAASPIATTIPVPAPAQTRRLWPWILGGGLSALLLATAAWLLARREDDQPTESDWLNRPMTPAELDVDTPPSSKIAPLPATDAIEVADDDSELDQAQFLLSEGQALEAIDLLYNVIDKDPAEVRAWLMLLRTLCQRDNRQEFAMVAERFQATNPDAADWDIVVAMGQDLDPENPLYCPPQPPIPSKPDIKGQPVLDFFAETRPSETATPAPKLDIGLDTLPEEPNPGDSPINQISRRDVA